MNDFKSKGVKFEIGTEESYHAVQSLNNVVEYKTVIYKGQKYFKVDYWEYLAKKRILDEAVKKGISQEEYNFVENQLLDVLLGLY